MQRDEILAEIKRTAEENGGKPLGKGRFERATGIGEYDWLKYWSRFGDLQREAGFEPNQLNAAYDDAYLLEKLIALTREQQRFPTERERKTKNRNDHDFPSAGVFRRFGSKEQLIARLVAYCADRSEYADVIKLLEPLIEGSLANGTGDVEPNNEKPSYGFVYLVKGHPGEYKIGRTNLVDRRLSELGATASVEPERIHVITTDDPSGVEAYWHNRFQDKQMRGEWYRLSPADVKAFRRWKKIY
jgi:hypothetical protein